MGVATAIITGTGGLVGSEAARHFDRLGLDVVGIENDMRASFFGSEASTERVSELLERDCETFRRERLDIRDAEAIDAAVRTPSAQHRARRPHRRAALTRLGRFRPPDRLHGQRQRHPESARGDAPLLP